MTITVAPARNELTANAGQTIFNWTFKIFSATDLNVYITPAGQDANDSTDLTTAYVVDPGSIGNPSGGFFTLTTPTNLNDLVTIVSNVPSSRTTNYQNNGDFRPDTVNPDFDRVVSIAKKVEDLTNRALLSPQSQQGVKPLALPNPVAQFIMRWRGDLAGLENVAFSELAPGIFPNDAFTLQSTLAAAKVDTGVLVGQVYIFSDRGDGIFDAISGTGSANGFDIVAHNTLPISFKLRVGENVDVVQFGAFIDSTGIGVGTDSSAVFIAAIAHGTGVHKVYVPGGGYRLSSTIFLNREGMSLVGESMQASVLNIDAGIIGVIGGNSPSTSNDIHDMLISDIHINGGTYPLQVGSVTSPLTYLGEVNRVRISGGTLGGLRIHQCIAEFNNLFVEENKIGLVTFNVANGGGFPTASQFNKCRFFNNTDQGMRAEHMLGFTFNTCTFESNGKEGIEFSFADAAGPWLRLVHFNSCHFENNMTGGGLLSASVLYTKLETLEMKDVTFTNCDFSGVQNFPSNVNVKGEVDHISFMNNLSIGPDIGGINLVTPTATGIYIGENRNDLSQERDMQFITFLDTKLQKPAFFAKNTSLAKTVFDAGATSGLETREDLGGITYMARAGNPLTINRLSTDGDSILLRKDGSTRGAIGTNANSLEVTYIFGGLFDSAGSGTPEAAVTAPIGSTYRRSDGGAGTSFYIKESGTGNTGWVAK